MKQTLACLSLSCGFCLLSLALCEISFLSLSDCEDGRRRRRRKKDLFVCGWRRCAFDLFVAFSGSGQREEEEERGRLLAGWLASSLPFCGLLALGCKEGRKEAGVGFVSLVPRFLEMV